jgi:hypothetical protein
MPISSRHKQRPGEWRDVLAPEILALYQGRHIAVIHKKVVAAGSTFTEVRTEANRLFPNEMPYLAYIPVPGDLEEDIYDDEEEEAA